MWKILMFLSDENVKQSVTCGSALSWWRTMSVCCCSGSFCLNCCNIMCKASPEVVHWQWSAVVLFVLDDWVVRNIIFITLTNTFCWLYFLQFDSEIIMKCPWYVNSTDVVKKHITEFFKMALKFLTQWLSTPFNMMLMARESNSSTLVSSWSQYARSHMHYLLKLIMCQPSSQTIVQWFSWTITTAVFTKTLQNVSHQ